ncbi:uncharacterized protein BDR25DRAFT_358332 [Lindgomyces ingoldianus]|uniref:Uncharacterized protein n=1 Tax=Lindgomyces ingoldianus TaxID=673940 RepID=A0ACB6QNF4_9PLEO|nr:uncharacterized protein BDR25DRAFT_358332 [Lindgomyces ingoldianus]KAF2467645.1 hypothetical protein BDR25DRAFT_358332 [Lindgomyces ingoldianus]
MSESHTNSQGNMEVANCHARVQTDLSHPRHSMFYPAHSSPFMPLAEQRELSLNQRTEFTHMVPIGEGFMAGPDLVVYLTKMPTDRYTFATSAEFARGRNTGSIFSLRADSFGRFRDTSCAMTALVDMAVVSGLAFTNDLRMEGPWSISLSRETWCRSLDPIAMPVARPKLASLEKSYELPDWYSHSIIRLWIGERPAMIASTTLSRSVFDLMASDSCVYSDRQSFDLKKVNGGYKSNMVDFRCNSSFSVEHDWGRINLLTISLELGRMLISWRTREMNRNAISSYLGKQGLSGTTNPG